jgi:hypothetical protein
MWHNTTPEDFETEVELSRVYEFDILDTEEQINSSRQNSFSNSVSKLKINRETCFILNEEEAKQKLEDEEGNFDGDLKGNIQDKSAKGVFLTLFNSTLLNHFLTKMNSRRNSRYEERKTSEQGSRGRRRESNRESYRKRRKLYTERFSKNFLVSDLLIFLSCLFAMQTIKFPHLHDYWKPPNCNNLQRFFHY